MKKLKSLGIFVGLILMVTGVIFLVFHRQMIAIIAFLAGGVMLVTGAVRLVQAFRLESYSGSSRIIKIVISAIMVAIGLFLIIDHNAAISLIGFVVGIFAFFCAFDRFSVASRRHKLRQPAAMTVMFGIINIFVGVFMIVASVQLVKLVVIFTGIYLLIEGIMIILSASYLNDLEEPEIIEGKCEVSEDDE